MPMCITLMLSRCTISRSMLRIFYVFTLSHNIILIEGNYTLIARNTRFRYAIPRIFFQGITHYLIISKILNPDRFLFLIFSIFTETNS